MKKIHHQSLLLIAASVYFTYFAAVGSAHGQEAKQLYDQTCAMCHGPEGKGDGPTAQVLQPKPANLATAIKGKNDAYLTKILKGGGASVGKSPLMPAYDGLLKDDQIKTLIKYVKGFAAS
ncbi:MAG: cytochrome c [Deltaproteobacteria bacterium]|nr:cytochrome c [Deltaproteobacteria bacterium]